MPPWRRRGPSYGRMARRRQGRICGECAWNAAPRRSGRRFQAHCGAVALSEQEVAGLQARKRDVLQGRDHPGMLLSTLTPSDHWIVERTVRSRFESRSTSRHSPGNTSSHSPPLPLRHRSFGTDRRAALGRSVSPTRHLTAARAPKCSWPARTRARPSPAGSIRWCRWPSAWTPPACRFSSSSRRARWSLATSCI